MPGRYKVPRDSCQILVDSFFFSNSACVQILWGECISGALYNEDFRRLAREAGFADPRILSSSRIDITDAQLAQVVGNAAFSSITYRLFKLPHHLESLWEDYGQVATYKVHLHTSDSRHQVQQLPVGP